MVRFFTAASSFYRRPALELNLKEVGDNEFVSNLYQDSNIEVDAVCIVCERILPKENEISSGTQKRPRLTLKNSVVSYIVTMKDIPGKFDPVAAKALNVPKGPLFRKLSKGETVTLSDGREIMPSQVVSEPSPGPCVAVICCPDIHFVPSIVSTPRLSRFALRNVQGSTNKERHLCVVHISTFAVLEDGGYRDWAISLGNDVHHILLLIDSLDAPLVFDSQAEFLKLLSDAVDRELFQVPKDMSFLTNSDDREAFHVQQGSIREKWSQVEMRFGECLLKYYLAPISKIGWDPNNVEVQSGVVNTELDLGTEKSFSTEKRKETEDWNPFEKGPSCFEDAGEVIFLGTGAAIPSKLRNVSGIYLHLYHRSGILLDCGEGTFGQMLRVFGPNEVNYFIDHLKLIFISHMHADHHLGILRILEYRSKLDTEQPLIIMGPSELSDWLKEYEQVTRQSFHYVFMDNEYFTCPQQPIVNYLSSNIGLQLETVPVLHCFHAYGVVLFDNLFEWKIVYSGDTMPCDALVRAGMATNVYYVFLFLMIWIGQGAILVIHEATFESSMEQIALEKGHCTYGQAVDVCKAMKARWIILTHFSQRYSKLPLIDSLTENNIFVAFDLLRVPFARLSQLPLSLPVLCELLAEEEQGNGKELA